MHRWTPQRSKPRRYILIDDEKGDDAEDARSQQQEEEKEEEGGSAFLSRYEDLIHTLRQHLTILKSEAEKHQREQERRFRVIEKAIAKLESEAERATGRKRWHIKTGVRRSTEVEQEGYRDEDDAPVLSQKRRRLNLNKRHQRNYEEEDVDLEGGMITSQKPKPKRQPERQVIDTDSHPYIPRLAYVGAEDSDQPETNWQLLDSDAELPRKSFMILIQSPGKKKSKRKQQQQQPREPSQQNRPSKPLKQPKRTALPLPLPPPSPGGPHSPLNPVPGPAPEAPHSQSPLFFDYGSDEEDEGDSDRLNLSLNGATTITTNNTLPQSMDLDDPDRDCAPDPPQPHSRKYIPPTFPHIHDRLPGWDEVEGDDQGDDTFPRDFVSSPGFFGAYNKRRQARGLAPLKRVTEEDVTPRKGKGKEKEGWGGGVAGSPLPVGRARAEGTFGSSEQRKRATEFLDDVLWPSP
ncbi:hypothetical protein BDZ91DRAFT_792608 [Kalaharituber pfeilii]|nr:hypothetical protein BDZ91DRAFT_792608 [Kalaharituber pfeilii]